MLLLERRLMTLRWRDASSMVHCGKIQLVLCGDRPCRALPSTVPIGCCMLVDAGASRSHCHLDIYREHCGRGICPSTAWPSLYTTAQTHEMTQERERHAKALTSPPLQAHLKTIQPSQRKVNATRILHPFSTLFRHPGQLTTARGRALSAQSSM